MTKAYAQNGDAAGTFLGHPKGLFVLFFAEMWERFSYYGMRALLIFYLTKHWLFSDGEAGVIYGAYTALVYITPVLGGYLADKWLGQRKAVLYGAILLTFGHFIMGFEGDGGQDPASLSIFWLALAFIIVGSGFLKANISVIVGQLYKRTDVRRDGAYTIFYMGINLGAFFAPLICGTLGQTVGWHYGFSAAGVGMIIGLVIYLGGQRYLAPDTLESAHHQKGQPVEPLTSAEWKRILALVFLCALNVVFWGVYEQQGNTMQLWADHRTDWVFLGMTIPSTWYQSFNPLMIFIFAPLLNIAWAWQNKRNFEPSSVTKMAIGCLLLGLAFVTMIFASNIVPEGERGSVLWLLTATFVLTIGELYLSPIGLSLVTKVAPARLVSMLMGMWFLSSFLGNYISGFLGTFYDRMDKDQFFMMLTALGIVTGMLMMAANRPLQRALGKEPT